MRRVLAAVLSVVALLGFLVVDASAQAPTSKVTISGLMDYVSTYSKNHSAVDLNFARDSDTEWYSRTRLRPDITAEVGTTKFVLGIEIDYTWGTMTGANTAGSGIRGTTAGLPYNTDSPGILELKWGYTEFDIPGLPFAARATVGAQPFRTFVTYKPGILATGDFTGANLTLTPAPQFKLLFTYAAAEEESTGRGDGFIRGDDHALILGAEITPFKGFDIKPVYAYLTIDGATGASRIARGGLTAAQCGSPPAGPCFNSGSLEERHTLGADMRLQLGPVGIFPTVMYQWGQRQFIQANQARVTQDRSAYLGDVRAAFSAGPLLLEAGASYTSGNRAQADVRNGSTDINFYESISQDGGYWSTWCELWCLDIDYNLGLSTGSPNISQVSQMGYDKYGRMVLAGKVTYAVTPSFNLRGMVNAQWAAQKVDTSSARTVAGNLTPGDFRGDSRYLGTEIDLGFRWTLAPGLDFDLIGAYLFTGKALEAATATSANGFTRPASNLEDIKAVTARVRYTF